VVVTETRVRGQDLSHLRDIAEDGGGEGEWIIITRIVGNMYVNWQVSGMLIIIF